MRYGFAVVAILCALIIGRLTVQEPAPRIQRVTETKIVTVPGLALPPPPRRRATLDDVRRDWKIEGKLRCHIEGAR